MPILTNPRHEKFAQELAKGESAHQAYINAGFRASRQNAGRLKTKDDIAARVLEIQQAAANRAEITIEGVLRELDEAISIAKQKGQPNALINAATLRSRLGGLLVDKALVVISSPDPYDDCQSPEDIGVVMADQMLGELTNARWLPITDADRVHLAGIFNRALAEAQAFVHSVSRRPHNNGQQPAAFLRLSG